jgi:DNA-binding winged helix-turn-helix (wHTH) protein
MPVERFGDFELDEEAAQLRLKGLEITLQPRVFSLLSYLVHNRDRVVDKDELLARLWPRMVVTDASLQRAVSLARSALRQGGLDNAIRTYARRGYRFCADTSGTRPDSGSALGKACAAIAESRWHDALIAYQQADSVQQLAPADLESWALAAQYAGALFKALEPLERAAAGYAEAGDVEAAARALILLARIQLESREMAVAGGCLRRAARLLEDQTLCEQHGHLEWMSSRFEVCEGDIQSAIAHAQRAIDIGKQLKDFDLQSIGLLYLGVALQANGDVHRGIALQDEAAAAVLSGTVTPLTGGIVYCGLISGCYNAGDWPRARQWTDSFTRWCERSRLKTFAGSCVLHRAAVFVAQGELDRALAEIDQGHIILRESAPWALGDAHRLLGDVYLARGQFEQAETAYRDAHEHGWDPYPGYAMLLHLRGQSQAALRGLRRAADSTDWVAGERRGQYLAYIALIATLSDDIELAVTTLKRLDDQPELWSTGSVYAQVCRARGELALAQGHIEAAISSFRTAVTTLRDIGLPVDASIIRLRLAECLAGTNDLEAAALELQAASGAFERSGSTYYLEQCAGLSENLRTPES